MDEGLEGRVPLIQSSEMNRQIKGVMVPTKKDFYGYNDNKQHFYEGFSFHDYII